MRLINIIEYGVNVSDKTVQEAIVMGYELASKERNLGMFRRLQNAATAYHKTTGKAVPPAGAAMK